MMKQGGQLDVADFIERQYDWLNLLEREMANYIVGQKRLVNRLLIALIINGHVLLEGVPGLAKTLALKTLAALVNAKFQRVQFTPDMLPADIIGTEIYNPKDLKFMIKHGPIFTNFLLADEINRAPAKVQSALLEAMAEHQTTIGEESFPMPEPFLVMATQNPIEQEGTYPLPEAQMDRFMLKIVLDYPSIEEERQILDLTAKTEDLPQPKPVVSLENIKETTKIINSIYVDKKIKEYIVSVVYSTRKPDLFNLEIKPYLTMGASPRATIAMTLAAKGYALLQKRSYVTPQDVKSVAHEVLRHRIALSYEAEAESITCDQLITKILETLPVP